MYVFSYYKNIKCKSNQIVVGLFKYPLIVMEYRTTPRFTG